MIDRHSPFVGNLFPNTPWEMNNMISPAIQKREVAITKGCTDVKPSFVAVDAEDHKIENSRPPIKNFQFPNERD